MRLHFSIKQKIEEWEAIPSRVAGTQGSNYY